MTKKPSAVPKILPREPLTKKALAAIEQYASVRGRGLNIHYWMVRYVLEAERMRRIDLYAWLEKRGYCWFSSPGRWVQRGSE